MNLRLVSALLMSVLLACGCGGDGDAAPAGALGGPLDAPTAQPSAPSPGLRLLAGDIGGWGNLDGRGGEARFSTPGGITSDGAGNLYVAEGSTIRRIDPTGLVTTLAGSFFQSGLRDGTGDQALLGVARLVADAQGTVYFTQGSTIRKVTPAGVVTTWAGTLEASAPVDSALASARFGQLGAITRDAAGNIYVVDDDTVIRKITPGGQVTTLAGARGTFGRQDGRGAEAKIRPVDLGVDANGTVYFLEAISIALRKVTPDGQVTTVLAPLESDPSELAFYSLTPRLAVDADGTVYVTGERGILRIGPDARVTRFARAPEPGANQASVIFRAITRAPSGDLFVSSQGEVLKITADGTVSSFAGRPSLSGYSEGVFGTARFNGIVAVAPDPTGLAYLIDGDGRTVRRVGWDGVVATLAGNPDPHTMRGYADGFREQARFNANGLVVDTAGTIYVTDTSGVIRKVTPQGVVTTLAGNAMMRGDADGSGSAAQFWQPSGIAIDDQGVMYVADPGADTVRRVARSGEVSTLARLRDQPRLVTCTDPRFCSWSVSRITVGPERIPYVSTGSGGLGRIVNGVLSSVEAPGTGEVRWLAMDHKGNLYGVSRQQIMRRDPRGELAAVAGTPGQVGIRTGPLPGSLGQVSAIAAMPPLPGSSIVRLLVASEQSLLLVTLPD